MGHLKAIGLIKTEFHQPRDTVIFMVKWERCVEMRSFSESEKSHVITQCDLHARPGERTDL